MAEKTAYAAEPAASLNGTREDFKVKSQPDNWNARLEGPEADLINLSGHIQKVNRNFGLLTLKGFGIN